jgi:hypothetical protein
MGLHGLLQGKFTFILLTRVRRAFYGQPMKYAWVSYRRTYTGSILKVDSTRYPVMTKQSAL